MSEEINYLQFKDLKIDPLIFTQGFVPGCELSICGGGCCHSGVLVDRDFKQIITEHEDKIKQVMDKFQPKDPSVWFHDEPEEDEDFPSGYAISTRVFEGSNGKEKCVFNDSIGRCSLQVMAVENGMPKWAVKPSYCIMYPLTIIDGVLTCDTEHAESLDYCGTNQSHNYVQTVFEATAEELKHIIGEEGYTFLHEHYIEFYKGTNPYNKSGKESA
jgi:hypothetical protein